MSKQISYPFKDNRHKKGRTIINIIQVPFEVK